MRVETAMGQRSRFPDVPPCFLSPFSYTISSWCSYQDQEQLQKAGYKIQSICVCKQRDGYSSSFSTSCISINIYIYPCTCSSTYTHYVMDVNVNEESKRKSPKSTGIPVKPLAEMHGNRNIMEINLVIFYTPNRPFVFVCDLFFFCVTLLIFLASRYLSKKPIANL